MILTLPKETLEAYHSREKMRRQWQELDERRAHRAERYVRQEDIDYVQQHIQPVTPSAWQRAMVALCGEWGKHTINNGD